jgi:glutaminase
MSCAELAHAGGFLARHGLRRDGSLLVSRSDAKRIDAIMLTCGTYDAAGEVAYRVGLPATSAISGGILAIIPGRCGAAEVALQADRSINRCLVANGHDLVAACACMHPDEDRGVVHHQIIAPDPGLLQALLCAPAMSLSSGALR